MTELIKQITDAATPAQHRENLSQMLIGYLNNPRTEETISVQDRQQVYHTFYTLNEFLKQI